MPAARKPVRPAPRSRRPAPTPVNAFPPRTERAYQAWLARRASAPAGWRAPGPVGTWIDELWEISIREHELGGMMAMIRKELPEAVKNPVGPEARARPVELKMELVTWQLEYMRMHLARVMTDSAHAATIGAAYAKPVCDLGHDYHRALVYGRHPDELAQISIQLSRRSSELMELLRSIQPAKAERIQKARASLEQFAPEKVERVRLALKRYGGKGQAEARYRASRPLQRTTFLRIAALLRESAGEGPGNRGTVGTEP